MFALFNLSILFDLIGFLYGLFQHVSNLRSWFCRYALIQIKVKYAYRCMQNYEVRWWDHPWHSSQRRLRALPALPALRVVWGQVQHSSRHWTTWSSSSLGQKKNDMGSENWKNYGKIRWYHKTVQSDQRDFHLHCKNKCHTGSLFCTMFYASEGMIYSKFRYPD